jgi:hypothetical protein
MMKRFVLSAVFVLSLVSAAPKSQTTQFEAPMPLCLPCGK